MCLPSNENQPTVTHQHLLGESEWRMFGNQKSTTAPSKAALHSAESKEKSEGQIVVNCQLGR